MYWIIHCWKSNDEQTFIYWCIIMAQWYILLIVNSKTATVLPCPPCTGICSLSKRPSAYLGFDVRSFRVWIYFITQREMMNIHFNQSVFLIVDQWWANPRLVFLVKVLSELFLSMCTSFLSKLPFSSYPAMGVMHTPDLLHHSERADEHLLVNWLTFDNEWPWPWPRFD